MPYGGPRFEFFTQTHFDNHTAAIRKEDAIRTAAIRAREEAAAGAALRRSTEAARQSRAQSQQRVEERDAAADAAALRRRRLTAELLEAAELADRHRIGNRGAASTILGNDPSHDAHHKGRPEDTAFAGSARVLALSAPREYVEPGYGALMHSSCAAKRTHRTELLMGHGGQPYTPGLDRDQIIPPRPAARAVKPWIGSYSTQRPTRQEVEERATARYYKGGGRGASLSSNYAAAALRAATINGMAAEHEARRRRAAAGTAADGGDSEGDDADGGSGGNKHYNSTRSYDGPVSPSASVFSHGSSNGPIAATGTRHMVAEPRADKAQVSLYLSQSGDRAEARARARVAAASRHGAPLHQLSLPELSYRVLSTQGLRSLTPLRSRN